jgi:hypothetical protein
MLNRTLGMRPLTGGEHWLYSHNRTDEVPYRPSTARYRYTRRRRICHRADIRRGYRRLQTSNLGPGPLPQEWRSLQSKPPDPSAQGPASLCHELARAMPPVAIFTWKIEAALRHVSADPYHIWFQLGMASHQRFRGSSEGRELWIEWSSGSCKFMQGEYERKWLTSEKRLQDPSRFGRFSTW